jgi:hypothetical protein
LSRRAPKAGFEGEEGAAPAQSEDA